MSARQSIPAAWPLLLSKEQACAFMGGLDERTFLKICPVAPLDLGARVLRWHRIHLEQWAEGLPCRLPAEQLPINHPIIETQNKTLTALDRAKARAQKDQSCRKTA